MRGAKKKKKMLANDWKDGSERSTCKSKHTELKTVILMTLCYILQIVYYEENITQRNEQKTAKKYRI